MGRTKGTQTSMEGWMMANGEKGEIFYSKKKDGALTAIANAYERKISTERLIVIGGTQLKPTVDTLTKIVLLNDSTRLMGKVINMGGI
jgi:hypothetical protein